MAVTIIGRYAIHDEIAAGGMATVHYGRLLGAAGFARTVAIKRLHPQFAKDPEFVAMFLDEARLAARVRHPNVVPTLDVVAKDGELFLVMEYVLGDSLSQIWRASERREIPVPIVTAILSGTLHGLHAAHQARGEDGQPLGLVHRDVSPQNILVGADGTVRVVDFGVAKAMGRTHTTRDGQIKGKLAYMAPEQLRRQPVSARTDIYAAGVVLWEILAGQRLFEGDSEAGIVGKILEDGVSPPSHVIPSVSPAMDAVVMRALSKDPAARFASAEDMATELERCERPALPSEVRAWVERSVGEKLRARLARITEIESGSSGPRSPSDPPPSDALSVPVELGTLGPSVVAEGTRPHRRGAVILAAGMVVTVVSAAVAVALLRPHRSSDAVSEVSAAQRSTETTSTSAQTDAPATPPGSATAPTSAPEAPSVSGAPPGAPTPSATTVRERPRIQRVPASSARAPSPPPPPAASSTHRLVGF